MRGGAFGAANLAVRFACELGALAAVVDGAVETRGGIVGVAVGLAAAALVAGVWGRWIAPKAPARLPDPQRLLLELLVFGAAVAWLALAGHGVLATILGLAALGSALLVRVWPEPVVRA